ncbi:MAG: hypothetical protein ACREJV_00440 [Candidatus Rokuibacteriota bacterium]
MRVLGPLVLALVLTLVSGTAANDARRAVASFVDRLSGASVIDLTIRQQLTIYHADGLHPHSTGDQVLYVKVPQRRRVEQTIEGRRETHLTVGDRAWVRQSDGRVDEVPRDRRAPDRTHLCVPLTRRPAALLAEWRGLGVRDDVSHQVRVRQRPVTVIGAKAGDRDSPAVWLDDEYGVVRVIARALPKGPGLVDLTCSEHRPLTNAVYFPHRQELFSGGKLLLRLIVHSVTVNGNLPDSLFDPDALRRER